MSSLLTIMAICLFIGILVAALRDQKQYARIRGDRLVVDQGRKHFETLPGNDLEVSVEIRDDLWSPGSFLFVHLNIASDHVEISGETRGFDNACQWLTDNGWDIDAAVAAMDSWSQQPVVRYANAGHRAPTELEQT